MGGAGLHPRRKALFANDPFNRAVRFDVDPDNWARPACHATGRNLTHEEWDQYVGDEVPYEVTCPEWPAGT